MLWMSWSIPTDREVDTCRGSETMELESHYKRAGDSVCVACRQHASICRPDPLHPFCRGHGGECILIDPDFDR